MDVNNRIKAIENRLTEIESEKNKGNMSKDKQ